MALPYAKIILDRLAAELKPRGFRKVAQTFIKPVEDCYQIVNLQASQFGTGESQRYTINLAVYSTRLEPLEKDATKLKTFEGHWEERIGRFTESRRDKWWQVRNDEEAASAAEEIVALVSLVLPAMDGISSFDALLRIPRGPQGQYEDPPGSTSKDALIEEARQREGLPPITRGEKVEGWRDAWHRRHYPDYVAPQPEPNPLIDAIMRSHQLGKSVPGVTLVTKEGVAPMAEDG